VTARGRSLACFSDAVGTEDFGWTPIAEHAVNALKRAVADELRKSEALLALERWRDAMACGKGGGRQFMTVQAVEGFRFDRFRARRPCAATIASTGGPNPGGRSRESECSGSIV